MLLICDNSFSKHIVDNKFGGLITGCSLVLVDYIDTGELWQTKGLVDEMVAD